MDLHMNNSKYNLPPQKPRLASGVATNGESTDWRHRKVYDGKELRPFEGRPGAMDAYNLPSRGIG